MTGEVKDKIYHWIDAILPAVPVGWLLAFQGGALEDLRAGRWIWGAWDIIAAVIFAAVLIGAGRMARGLDSVKAEDAARDAARLDGSIIWRLLYTTAGAALLAYLMYH